MNVWNRMELRPSLQLHIKKKGGCYPPPRLCVCVGGGGLSVWAITVCRRRRRECLSKAVVIPFSMIPKINSAVCPYMVGLGLSIPLSSLLSPSLWAYVFRNFLLPLTEHVLVLVRRRCSSRWCERLLPAAEPTLEMTIYVKQINLDKPHPENLQTSYSSFSLKDMLYVKNIWNKVGENETLSD